MPLAAALLLFAACQPSAVQPASASPAPPRPAYTIAIHGGAGADPRSEMSAEQEATYRAALDSALTLGENILKNGGTSLDAATQVVAWLEDCPLFNAGRGAAFTHEGKNELDASIMDGKTQMAGAVGGVTIVKNPIKLARMVMEKTEHVLLTGRGAEQFAKENGLELVDPKYFYTEKRWKSLEKILTEEKKKSKTGSLSPDENFMQRAKYGTVGCVALDNAGNLAAATSTGGTTNKRWNRLGDTPLIGAGNYASNDACAVSCTGHGEYFMRYVVAYDVWALMSYKGMPLKDAADFVINQKLKTKGGGGGLIAVDKNGNVALPFNSDGMYRGYAKPGEREIAIH